MPKAVLLKNYGIPNLAVPSKKSADQKNLSLFDLSSHHRAKTALDFAIKMRDPGFNVFVIAGSRTGTMEATLNYIKSNLSDVPPPCDLVYLNNFKEPSKPYFCKFPTGIANKFKEELGQTIRKIKESLLKNFADPEFIKAIKKEEQSVEHMVQKTLDKVRHFAVSHQLDIHRAKDESLVIVFKTEKGFTPVEELPDSMQKKLAPLLKKIHEGLASLTQIALSEGDNLSERLDHLKRSRASEVINPHLEKLEKAYATVNGMQEWIHAMQEDMLKHLHLFLNTQNDLKKKDEVSLDKWYAIHVLVSNDGMSHLPVILEPNPSYENLFGSIKYYTTPMGGFETDFTMIFPGSLHKANGGILVLRGEELANNPQTWHFLKAALRDKEIRIEELYRVAGVPLLEAPDPQPIPLDVQIVLVGDPKWYYSFFFADDEFQDYFKIKSDIDATISIGPKNLEIISCLLQEYCIKELKYAVESSALKYVISYGCRLANHRKKITADISVFKDILKEASVFAKTDSKKSIRQEDVVHAIEGRHRRNSKFQDLEQEYLEEDLIMIKTRGMATGQINGLTVQSIGSETFGSPSRITARTYMGRHGVINIEHAVDMGGPLQHKGVLSLEGFLKGLLAKYFPISFSANITFEQNYTGVEGDSASIAELLAILSSLGNVPLRQDIAITGSMNQFGLVQPIGSVNEKVEGFYYACKRQGLTGTQGVMIPKGNETNLNLLPEVSKAIDEGKFSVWSFDDVFDAVELFTGLESGHQMFLKETDKTKETVFGKVYEQLRFYDTELKKRLLDTEMN
ncbi:MAG: AAA family ATPase [Alphaproteobacteria bacterium]